MKTIQTDDGMTWALTESNSDFGKWIISGVFPNIRLKFPERLSSLRGSGRCSEFVSGTTPTSLG